MNIPSWVLVTAGVVGLAVYFLPTWWKLVPESVRSRLPFGGSNVDKLAAYIEQKVASKAANYDDAIGSLRLVLAVDGTLSAEVEAILTKLQAKKNADEKAALLGGGK